MEDYLHTEDNDLLIADGDFVVGETTQQAQSLLLRIKKGELRQYPKTGVGIDDFLVDDNPGDIYREIQLQFEADGMTVRKIDINLDEVKNTLDAKVDASYLI